MKNKEKDIIKYKAVEYCSREDSNPKTTAERWKQCVKKICPRVEAVRYGKNPNIGQYKEKFELTENAVNKVEKTLNTVVNPAADVINKPLNTMEKEVRKNPWIDRLMQELDKDSAKLSKSQNAKEWALGMGAGSVLMHIPQLVTQGPTAIPQVAATALANAGKGALIGPLLSKGEDSFLKNVMVPAGVTAITTPLINKVGHLMGIDDEIDFIPEARVGMAGAIGGGLWAWRNRNNKNRIWI